VPRSASPPEERPVPPQVIPRPGDWRPGGPPPWADLAPARRTSIGLDRVVAALGALGQGGPAPGEIDAEGVVGPALLMSESLLPPVRVVNSGVLALLFEEEGEARVVLTRRSSHLRTHRGEVSFPGGRLDEGEDPASAARREAHEEVGLEPASVASIGWLHPVMTMVSASLILPIVATVPGRPRLVANPAEVERVFDVTLAELADPAVFHEEHWRIPGRVIQDSADGSFPVWFFEVSGEMIWGATARMLHELLSVVLTGRSGRRAS
jgi:8-oxo-dGTP pyrophosphatase MutT (NUDIX family)